jgi:hypothetical protein
MVSRQALRAFLNHRKRQALRALLDRR